MKNYYSIATTSTGNVTGETYVSNVDASPLAADSALPKYWQTLFNGNGTWATDVNGWDTYDTGEVGQPVKTGKALFAGHFKPVAGWAVNAGCSDPHSWPTAWATVPTNTP